MTRTLTLSDGTTTLNFFDPVVNGLKLYDWDPKTAQWKNGGVFQDSPISDGRRLRFRKYQTVEEDMKVYVVGSSADDVSAKLQALIDMLEDAVSYWEDKHSNVPVTLASKANAETGTRYALVHSYTIGDLPYIYSGPLELGADADNIAYQSAMAIELTIERGHWQSTIPGTGECVEISSVQEWEYDAVWASVDISPGTARSLIQSSTDRIFARKLLAISGEILYSDDDGGSWALSTAIGGLAYSLLQTTTNRILVAKTGVMGEDDEIWYSDDDGGTWTPVVAATTGRALLQTNTGRILDGKIYSDDDGDTWTSATSPPPGAIYSLLQTTSGRILAGVNGQIWYSNDDGDTWTLLVSKMSSFVQALIQVNTGRILAGDTYKMWYSDDDGDTWAQGNVTLEGSVRSFLQTTDNKIFLGENEILYSNNNGESWSVANENLVAASYSLLEITTGRVIAGDDDQVLLYGPVSSTEMGNEDSCVDEVFVSNKNNDANLSNIFIDDGGVFSANLFPMTLPTTLLPAVPAVNDAVYFGIETSAINSGPFTSLIFDILTPISVTTSYTILWEYWTGAAWATLTTRDGTNPGTGVFRALGVSSVHWTPPSNWATVAVNSVTGYWVRARVSALVGTLTPPVQQNRNIYSVVNSYVDVDNLEILGDIPALSQIKAHNHSDLDGPAGSAPNLYDNRLIVGLRSYDRGTTFQPYLNISDEQNPFGVTIAVGTSTTIGNDIAAPTGRSATYNPAGVEAMATRASVALATTIARDFYGTFRAFLRVQRTAGNATDFDIRLQVSSGSGGVSYTTASKQVQTTTAFELLDFGQVTIPATGSLTSDELGDQTVINIQASAASGTPNLILYDLILMPVDEWVIDAVDGANESDSDIGRSGSISKYLDIDSITNPKEKIRSLVKQVDSNLITSVYTPNSNGQAILQNKKDQRLWFLAAKTSATGTSYSWIASPEICHSIQLYKVERYLALRGNS